MPTLYTIGHSTRAKDEFLELLQSFKITHLVDVRTIPKSRRMPWFNQIELRKFLKNKQITYTHLAELGGLRHALKDSINLGWHNTSFRGFADYMQTPEFFIGLKTLIEIINNSDHVAIMCAEAVPWRCHRSLISDALMVRHIKVLHILSKTNARAHELTAFAQVDRSKRPIIITYPEKESLQKSLF